MKTVLLSLLILVGSSAQAGECLLNVTRTSCAGQEAESFKKCDGKVTCDEKKEAKSEKDCAKKALKSCENARLDITKSKVITAKFDGKAVEGGKNFCDSDRADFNKCK